MKKFLKILVLVAIPVLMFRESRPLLEGPHEFWGHVMQGLSMGLFYVAGCVSVWIVEKR